MAKPQRTLAEKPTETITAAAISLNGATWALPAPRTHTDVGDWILNNCPHIKKLDGTPGYVTSKRRFVKMDEAKEIAEKNKQELW